MFAFASLLLIAISVPFTTEDDTTDHANSEWILRMEYKLSFKPPQIAANDNTVPLWEVGGHVIPSAEEVRLTASVPNQKGSLWASKAFESPNWQFETAFRITGKGQTGTNGLAFWFVKEKPEDTSTFGGPSKWNGLAIILDSLDNDNKGNNPLVAAYLNNGSMTYDMQRDGENQFHAYQIYDYRNKPFPIHMKVRYYHNVLTLDISDGLTAAPTYHTWGIIENVQLPNRCFFGLTSSTGPVNPDDHDVYTFLVHSIVPRDHAVREDTYYRKQMDDYVKKSEEIHAAQIEYARQHPDKVHPYHHPGQDQAMSMGTQHDMRNLFEMHSEIRQAVNHIMARLNEVVGRQESSASAIVNLANSVHAAGPGSNTAMQSSSHEIQRILQSQSEVVESNRRLIKDVQDILMRVSHLDPSTKPDSINFHRSLMEKVTTLVNRKPQKEQKQINNKILWLIVILQAFTLIGALIMIGRSDQMSKKFY